MTRQQLRDQLRSELKIDPNGRVWSDTILNRNVEQARRQIQQDGSYDWSFNDGEGTVTTAVGTAEYSLPTGFIRMELVKYSNTMVSPTTKSWLKKHNSSLAVNGTPVYYYLLGSNIGFFHRPDAIVAVEVDYRKKLADFTSDSSAEEMPDEFAEAIVQYAAYLSWSDVQGREDKAVQAVQNYKQALEGLFDSYLARDNADYSFKFEVI